MPSNYHRILQSNLHEYGHGERHLAFLGRLYTDRTHFIYELLQNAEDAAATRVKLSLYADRLEVLHDGRVFNEADVIGVCAVGSGTKEEDLTQIGKFGIGFKSVYAFTRTPEVHSGDEHFCIESYVRPHGVESINITPPWTTLFRFPFDHQDIPRETAFTEIAERLQKLGLRTLLFLRNIQQIEWDIVGHATGIYLRDTDDFHGVADRIVLLGQRNEDTLEERWLVFRRAIVLRGQEAIEERKRVRVEAAFRIEETNEAEGPASLRIVRLTDSPLVVFFPTSKTTSLGFLIQGPYRTTPARDNIPERDPWNARLVAETAELLVKVLRVFRREGYLSPEVLESLPIQPAAFPGDSMFRPVFERVRRAFAEEPLLPDDTGDAVCAGNAVLSRGSGLRELLSPSQLAQLLNKNVPLKWLSGEITQDRTPVLRSYLRTELGISELEPERFARLISEPFLVQQPDAWMVRFYSYLLRQEALWGTKALGRSEGLLRKQPILRLSDGRHVVPFKADGTPAAYLQGECDLRVPVVKENIAADEQASEFLRRLGLREPDPVDEVCASLLPKYRRVPQPCPSDDEYASDVQAILAAIRTDSSINRLRVITDAKKTPFLLATNAKTGRRELKTPLELYKRSDDLALYFSDKPDAWFLAEEAPLDLLEAKDCELLGIAGLPRLLHLTPVLTAEEKDKLRGGMKNTRRHGERLADYDIDGLAEALALAERIAGTQRATNIGRVIWDVVLQLLAQHGHDGFWRGRYEWFNYQPRESAFEATLLRRLKQSCWIPDRNGVPHKPSNLDVSDLPDDFVRHDNVIEQLGINNAHDERQQQLAERETYAARLGVDLSIIEFIRQHSEAFTRFRNAIAERQSVAPAFPESTSANPVRREARIQESRKEAASKTYEKRERSIRTSAPSLDPKMWLRDNYTNDNDQMVCQICEQEMPFKMPPNGDYYFEAVELTRRAEFEHHAMRLALCPVCAARYRVFIHQSPEAQAAVEAALLATETTEAQSPRISLELGYEKGTLRFVHKHLVDVKGLLGR